MVAPSWWPGSCRHRSRRSFAIRPADKDFLSSFLDAVVFSLLPAEHTSRRIPRTRHTRRGPRAILRRRTGCSRESTKRRPGEFLTNLLADLLGGPHAYLLPCEAVFRLSFARAPDRTKRRRDEGRRSKLRAVPATVRFPIFSNTTRPAGRRPEQIIDRRFGLFIAAGGMGE